MLNLHRRHSATKCGKTKKRDCTCPIWVTGSLHGQRMRKSLGIRNWEAAQSIVRGWESRLFGSLSVKEAIDRYLADCAARGLSLETMRKYQLLGREMVSRFGQLPVDSVGIDALSEYRESWKLSPATSRNKVERLRAFFKFCIDRKWCSDNPALLIKNPRAVHKPTLPVSDEDFEKLIDACEGRERVKAFLLMLRYSGLRIQDCIRLKRSAINDGKLFLYSSKTSVPVWMPLPDFVISEVMKWEGEYFFWTGVGSIRTAIGNWERALERVGKVAGVKFHAHRLRDSFAVSLLSKGVSLENVATLLGNSPAICFRHYSPWIKKRQDALEAEVRSSWNFTRM
jgi:integrase/recombinase XerD